MDAMRGKRERMVGLDWMRLDVKGLTKKNLEMEALCHEGVRVKVMRKCYGE
jgi:hypothetical protein